MWKIKNLAYCSVILSCLLFNEAEGRRSFRGGRIRTSTFSRSYSGSGGYGGAGNVGVILGIIGGVIALAIVIVVVCIICCNRRKSRLPTYYSQSTVGGPGKAIVRTSDGPGKAIVRTSDGPGKAIVGTSGVPGKVMAGTSGGPAVKVVVGPSRGPVKAMGNPSWRPQHNITLVDASKKPQSAHYPTVISVPSTARRHDLASGQILGVRRDYSGIYQGGVNGNIKGPKQDVSIVKRDKKALPHL